MIIVTNVKAIKIIRKGEAHHILKIISDCHCSHHYYYVTAGMATPADNQGINTSGQTSSIMPQGSEECVPQDIKEGGAEDTKEGDEEDKIATNLVGSNCKKSYMKDNHMVNHIDWDIM